MALVVFLQENEDVPSVYRYLKIFWEMVPCVYILSWKNIIVTSLKLLQSDRLLKCKDIMIMTLRGAKTIFLDTWYATIEKT